MTSAAPKGAALPENDRTGHLISTPAVPRPASKNASQLNYPPCTTADLIERSWQMWPVAMGAYMLLGSAHWLRRMLRAGETDPIEFVRAHYLIEALPSLVQRKLLSTFAGVTWPSTRRAPR